MEVLKEFCIGIVILAALVFIAGIIIALLDFIKNFLFKRCPNCNHIMDLNNIVEDSEGNISYFDFVCPHCGTHDMIPSEDVSPFDN